MPTTTRNTQSLRWLFAFLALAGFGIAAAPSHAYAAPVDVSAYSTVNTTTWEFKLPAGSPIPGGSEAGQFSSCFMTQANFDALIASNPQNYPDFSGATGCVGNWGGSGGSFDSNANGLSDADIGPFDIDAGLDSWSGFNAFKDGNEHVIVFFGGSTGSPYPIRWYFHTTFRYAIGIDEPTPPDTSDRIDTFTVDSGTNTVNITGYWNHTSETLFDSLMIQQSSQHLPLEYLPEFYSNGPLVATSTGAFDFTFEYTPIPDFSGTGTSTLPISQNLTFKATLYHTDRDTYTCDSLFPIDTDGDGDPDYCDPRSVAIADTATVILEDGRVGYSDITTSAGLASFPEYECGLTALSGCLKNAFLWLFYPAGDTVAQFRSLSLADRWPFAYAYQVGEIRNAVFSSPTTASTTIQVSTPMGDITFLSAAMMSSVPFAALIKTLLSAVMWFMAVMVIYRRILASHDTQTHV